MFYNMFRIVFILNYAVTYDMLIKLVQKQIWYLRVDPKQDFIFIVGELSTVLAIQRFATMQNSILWLVPRTGHQSRYINIGASSGRQRIARWKIF